MHKVVVNTDWSIIRPQGYDRLVLSACHPLYSASHRWVVFARAISVTLPGKNGRTIKLPA
jgi:sortase (surface protein transpeptidase)